MVEHNKDLVLAKIKQYFPHEVQGKILSSLSLSAILGLENHCN